MAVAGCGGSETRVWSKGAVPPTTKSTTAAKAGAVILDSEQMLEVQLAAARTLEQQGDLERAESAYRTLQVARPNDAKIRHRLAIVCDRQNRFAESERFFRDALAGDHEDPALLTDFGYSLYRQSRWNEAEQMLRRAVARRPGDRRAHNHLGLVLCQTGRREDALAQFQLAGCGLAESHMNVALVLTMNDRFEEARREYALALSQGPASRKLLDQARELDGLLADAGVEAGEDAGQIVEVGARESLAPGAPPRPRSGYARLTGE